MPQYEAFDSGVEVDGQAVRSVVEGVGSFSETYEQRALDILENNGIPDPQPGEWHDMQSYLDAFRELAETVGPNTVKRIGRKIPEVVEWPPAIDSAPAALSALEEVYQMNHRGGEIGYYDFETTDDSAGAMTCENPYPPELDEGIVEGVAKKFADQPAFVRVKEVERSDDGERSVCEVSW